MANSEYKNCPYCDEKIKKEAIKCRYCETLLYEKRFAFNKDKSNESTFDRKQVVRPVNNYQPPLPKRKKNPGLLALLYVGSMILIFGAISIFYNSVEGDRDNNFSESEYSYVDVSSPDKDDEFVVMEQETEEVIGTNDTTVGFMEGDSDEDPLEQIPHEDENEENEEIQGTIPWNGGAYTGALYNGVPDGWGTWVDQSGKTYTGNFMNGSMTGYGTMIFPGGEEYVGYFKDGLGYGQGKMTHPDGRSVSGAWIDGVYQGN